MLIFSVSLTLGVLIVVMLTFTEYCYAVMITGERRRLSPEDLRPRLHGGRDILGDRHPQDQRLLHRRPPHEEVQREREGPLSHLLLPVALLHLQRKIQVRQLLGDLC
jgi:hypothetical protein